MTFGYIPKNTHIRHNFPKEHCIVARRISGNLLENRLSTAFIKEEYVAITDRHISVLLVKVGTAREIKLSTLLKSFVCLIGFPPRQGVLCLCYTKTEYFNIRDL